MQEKTAKQVQNEVLERFLNLDKWRDLELIPDKTETNTQDTRVKMICVEITTLVADQKTCEFIEAFSHLLRISRTKSVNYKVIYWLSMLIAEQRAFVIQTNPAHIAEVSGIGRTNTGRDYKKLQQIGVKITVDVHGSVIDLQTFL
ncbi:hypothetical protein [Pseudothermotoga elfii]|jgi:hypothetical protein